MFGLFRKAKASGSGTAAQPDVAQIFVDAAAFTPEADIWAASQSLVDYVNALMQQGLYRRDEIPAEAMWLYHADYYVAQVQNGGHSQFLHNSRQSDWILNDALQGMTLIGAETQTACLRDMMAWAKDNPGVAAEQDGFGNRAPALDDIDSRFFGIDKDIYYTAVRQWLQQADIVAVLPKAELTQAVDHLIAQNPERENRQRFAHIAQLQHGLVDPVLAMYRAAPGAALINNAPFKVLALTAGFPMGHPTQKDGVIWGVQTNMGVLAGYIDDESVVLTQSTKENGFGVGDVVLRSPRDEAENCIAFAQDMPVAAIATEAIRRVKSTTQLAYLAPLLKTPKADKKGVLTMVYLCETADNTLYALALNATRAALSAYPKGAVMTELKARDFATLERDINAHSAYVPWR